MASADSWTSFQIAQAISWSVAGLVGAITAWKALVELRRTRDQGERELRWRKAKEAKTVIEEVTKHPGVSAALRMIDWDGRVHRFPDGQHRVVTHVQIINALRTSGPYTHTEAYIRDCFDDLFDSLSRVEAMLVSGLLEFADIRQFFLYYAGRMRGHRIVFSKYIAAYGFEAAGQLLKRLGDQDGNSETSVYKPAGVIQSEPISDVETDRR